MLLARAGRVHVPEMVAAGKGGPGAAVLVDQPPQGRNSRMSDAGSVTDDLLRGVGPGR